MTVPIPLPSEKMPTPAPSPMRPLFWEVLLEMVL